MGLLLIVCFRPPTYDYSKKMRTKTKSWVLDITLADPKTTEGITEIIKLYTKYTPVISECGNVRAKGSVNGRLELRKTNKYRVLRSYDGEHLNQRVPGGTD